MINSSLSGPLLPYPDPMVFDYLSTLKTVAYLSCKRYLVKSSGKPKFGILVIILGFPGGSVVKNLFANAEDTGLIPGSGRFPGEGNGNPLWYSCLGNRKDRGAWWATVHGVTKESDTT